jgi:hypothetical protein
MAEDSSWFLFVLSVGIATHRNAFDNVLLDGVFPMRQKFVVIVGESPHFGVGRMGEGSHCDMPDPSGQIPRYSNRRFRASYGVFLL